MKKAVILALFIIYIVAGSAYGQEKKQIISDDVYIAYLKNEFYLQYGAPSIVEFTNKLGNGSYVNNEKKFKEGGSAYTGIVAAGYNRYLNPYFCVGAYIGAGESELKVKDSKTDKVVYSNNIQSITAMLNFGWTYYRKGIWEISCGVSAGVANKDEHIQQIDKNQQFIPKEEDRLAFAYNFTVAKVRIGGGIIGGFAEFGFGYKGIANGGLSIRF